MSAILPSATRAASPASVYIRAAASSTTTNTSSISQAIASLSSVIKAAESSIAVESSAASGNAANPAYYKYIGLCLAIASGLLIGSSFVFKKKGLISSQKKYETNAGEGYAYLKSPLWWCGMIIMIVGEIFNFVAYSFAPALLVTPFGALAVCTSALLSSLVLGEILTLVGKIGIWLCVVGSVVVALNGPDHTASGEIDQFRTLFISVGFLVWIGVCCIFSVILAFWAAPRWGKKYMLIYIGICSLLGGLSVSTTSGLGAAILMSIRGHNQMTHWFMYVLLGFVAVTLVLEIIFLNKALALFNSAMVTSTYFVTFTSCSIISTIILFQGLDATAAEIVTLVMGFLVTCTGITLLQLSKIDPEDLTAEAEEPPSALPGIQLDRSTTLLMRASRSFVNTHTEKGESTALEDPGIDAIRGSAGLIGSIVRARSSKRFSRSSADAYANLNEHGMQQLNTGGMRADLPRYQLSDNPMRRGTSSSSGRGAGTGTGTGTAGAGGAGGGAWTHNGMLSPTIGGGPPDWHTQNMPKRGRSVISFTSGAMRPHGHHGDAEEREPLSPSRGEHRPDEKPTTPIKSILASPRRQNFGDRSNLMGLTLSSSGRQLSDIKESDFNVSNASLYTNNLPYRYDPDTSAGIGSVSMGDLSYEKNSQALSPSLGMDVFESRRAKNASATAQSPTRQGQNQKPSAKQQQQQQQQQRNGQDQRRGPPEWNMTLDGPSNQSADTLDEKQPDSYPYASSTKPSDTQRLGADLYANYPDSYGTTPISTAASSTESLGLNISYDDGNSARDGAGRQEQTSGAGGSRRGAVYYHDPYEPSTSPAYDHLALNPSNHSPYAVVSGSSSTVDSISARPPVHRIPPPGGSATSRYAPSAGRGQSSGLEASEDSKGYGRSARDGSVDTSTSVATVVARDGERERERMGPSPTAQSRIPQTSANRPPYFDGNGSRGSNVSSDIPSPSAGSAAAGVGAGAGAVGRSPDLDELYDHYRHPRSFSSSSTAPAPSPYTAASGNGNGADSRNQAQQQPHGQALLSPILAGIKGTSSSSSSARQPMQR